MKMACKPNLQIEGDSLLLFQYRRAFARAGAFTGVSIAFLANGRREGLGLIGHGG